MLDYHEKIHIFLRSLDWNLVNNIRKRVLKNLVGQMSFFDGQLLQIKAIKRLFVSAISFSRTPWQHV